MTGPLFGPSPNQFHDQYLSGVSADGESAVDLPNELALFLLRVAGETLRDTPGLRQVNAE